MKEDLELMARPKRKRSEQQAEAAAAERAYEIAHKRAKVQAARMEGVAAAKAEQAEAPAGALERARQRALGQVAAPAAPPKPPAPPQPKTASGRTVRLESGETVPIEFYDLAPAEQQRMLELIRERTEEKKASHRLDAVGLQLLDLQDKQAQRIGVLEHQLTTALVVIERLQGRLDQMDLKVQAEKSAALLEQEAAIGQAITNLSAIRAESGIEAAQHAAEAEAQAVEHRARLEATERVLSAMEGRLKSAGELYLQRGAAVEDQVANVESRVAKAEVKQTQLDGQIDAIGSPITRAEVQNDITMAVTSELKAQSPVLVNEAIETIYRDEFPGGSIFGQRVDGERTRQLRSDVEAFRASQREGT